MAQPAQPVVAQAAIAAELTLADVKLAIAVQLDLGDVSKKSFQWVVDAASYKQPQQGSSQLGTKLIIP